MKKDKPAGPPERGPTNASRQKPIFPLLRGHQNIDFENQVKEQELVKMMENLRISSSPSGPSSSPQNKGKEEQKRKTKKKAPASVYRAGQEEKPVDDHGAGASSPGVGTSSTRTTLKYDGTSATSAFVGDHNSGTKKQSALAVQIDKRRLHAEQRNRVSAVTGGPPLVPGDEPDFLKIGIRALTETKNPQSVSALFQPMWINKYANGVELLQSYRVLSPDAAQRPDLPNVLNTAVCGAASRMSFQPSNPFASQSAALMRRWRPPSEEVLLASPPVLDRQGLGEIVLSIPRWRDEIRHRIGNVRKHDTNTNPAWVTVDLPPLPFSVIGCNCPESRGGKAWLDQLGSSPGAAGLTCEFLDGDMRVLTARHLTALEHINFLQRYNDNSQEKCVGNVFNTHAREVEQPTPTALDSTRRSSSSRPGGGSHDQDGDLHRRFQIEDGSFEVTQRTPKVYPRVFDTTMLTASSEPNGAAYHQHCREWQRMHCQTAKRELFRRTVQRQQLLRFLFLHTAEKSNHAEAEINNVAASGRDNCSNSAGVSLSTCAAKNCLANASSPAQGVGGDRSSAETTNSSAAARKLVHRKQTYSEQAQLGSSSAPTASSSTAPASTCTVFNAKPAQRSSSLPSAKKPAYCGCTCKDRNKKNKATTAKTVEVGASPPIVLSPHLSVQELDLVGDMMLRARVKFYEHVKVLGDLYALALLDFYWPKGPLKERRVNLLVQNLKSIVDFLHLFHEETAEFP
ncbi:unnamed protein product [Amoebophrya sp. A120]|nr:unnamed protein product [Amoebophrya sp. A120]|eukprot:GSA120T00003576001.1